MNRDLTPEEVAAMWLYGEEYSQQNLGIIDWYARQNESRKRVVADFVVAMRAALESSTPERPVDYCEGNDTYGSRMGL